MEGLLPQGWGHTRGGGDGYWVSWNRMAGRDCPLMGPEFKGEPWSGKLLGPLHTAGRDATG